MPQSKLFPKSIENTVNNVSCDSASIFLRCWDFNLNGNIICQLLFLIVFFSFIWRILIRNAEWRTEHHVMIWLWLVKNRLVFHSSYPLQLFTELCSFGNFVEWEDVSLCKHALNSWTATCIAQNRRLLIGTSTMHRHFHARLVIAILYFRENVFDKDWKQFYSCSWT